jgi:hypothetical protein
MIQRRTLLKAALAAVTVPAAGRVCAAPPPKLAAPPEDSVDAAISTGLTRYNRNLKGGAHTNRGGSGGAPVLLALAAFTGETRADNRLLEQMRYTLTGGNDISANGGYPAQHERSVTAMFAIARLTPRIWKQLTADETARADRRDRPGSKDPRDLRSLCLRASAGKA